MTNPEVMAGIFIDTIQDAKRSFVNTWFKDEALNKPMNDFIEAQRQFTKTVVKTTHHLANAAGDIMNKVTK